MWLCLHVTWLCYCLQVNTWLCYCLLWPRGSVIAHIRHGLAFKCHIKEKFGREEEEGTEGVNADTGSEEGEEEEGGAKRGSAREEREERRGSKR